jgi:predicted N-acetyltransferase YhbS
LRARSRRHAIPTILVAFVGGAPIGSVALVEYDMSIFRQYSPWLSGMYVVAEQRERGVGTQLLRACEAEAASLGVETLYLYTHSAAPFYRRHGWQAFARSVYGGETVALMSKALDRPTSPAGDRA